jgi:genome maintenance exonuclease 1
LIETENHLNYNYTPCVIECEELRVVENKYGRAYISPTGKPLPSVTTVTGFEGKDGFDIWKRKNPQEMQRVCDRGNTIHSMMEHLLKNEEVVLCEQEDVNALYRNLRDHVETKIDNVYALEKHMWSDRIGLAGRVDCICDYDGKLSVVDFKGSTREKYESGIKGYFMQATAYALMFQELTGRKVEQIVILVSCETGTLQEFIKKPIEYVPGLLRAIHLYNQWQELQPTTSLVSLDQ